MPSIATIPRVLRAALLAAVLTPVAAPPHAAAFDLAIDQAQELDPPVRVPRDGLAFSEKLLPLWLEALDRPDAEPRRLAIDTLALAAERGMPGLDAAVP